MVWGIAVISWVIGIHMLLTPEMEDNIMSGVGTIIAGWGAPWFWLTTRYKLYESYMMLLSGPFFKKIYYADITGVRNGRSEKGMSFAFSMDCLQIDVAGSWGGFRVSPKERRRFLSILAAYCNQLQLENHQLVLKNKYNAGM